MLCEFKSEARTLRLSCSASVMATNVQESLMTVLPVQWLWKILIAIPLLSQRAAQHQRPFPFVPHRSSLAAFLSVYSRAAHASSLLFFVARVYISI